MDNCFTFLDFSDKNGSEASPWSYPAGAQKVREKGLFN